MSGIFSKLAAKINWSAKTERKGTNTIDSPPTSAPLLSFSIQDPWALCQLRILRTHSKKAKERDLFKIRTHSLLVSCFSLHFPHEDRFWIAVFNVFEEWWEGGGSGRQGVVWGVNCHSCNVSSHSCFESIVSERSPSWAPPPLSLSQFSFCFYSLCLPTLAPAHIVTPPPHYPLSLHTVLGWRDAILGPARDAGEGEGGKSQIYSAGMHRALWMQVTITLRSVPAKIDVCFHQGWQWGKEAASVMFQRFHMLYAVLQHVLAVLSVSEMHVFLVNYN